MKELQIVLNKFVRTKLTNRTAAAESKKNSLYKHQNDRDKENAMVDPMVERPCDPQWIVKTHIGDSRPNTKPK